jgi:hypothetical protein
MHPEFQGAVPFAMPVQKLLSTEWSERKESVGPQELEVVAVGGHNIMYWLGRAARCVLLIYIGVAPSKTGREKYPRCKLCAHTHSYNLRASSNMQNQYCFYFYFRNLISNVIYTNINFITKIIISKNFVNNTQQTTNLQDNTSTHMDIRHRTLGMC